MQLEDRICLVTGATGGIGWALCHALAQAGAKLVLTGRNAEQLQALRSELASQQVLDLVVADQLDSDALAGLVRRAAQHGVNTLVNLSGVNQLALFEDLGTSALADMITLNLLAPMNLSQQLLPHLREAGDGLIVNVGSAFGSIGYPGYVAYCASKSGLRGFSEALRRELSDSDVEVLYVAPRATATAMNAGGANDLNAALGNRTDAPAWVAQQILKAMDKRRKVSFLGWPEKFFVKLNGLLPLMVDGSLVKQLPTVRQHARGGSSQANTLNDEDYQNEAIS